MPPSLKVGKVVTSSGLHNEVEQKCIEKLNKQNQNLFSTLNDYRHSHSNTDDRIKLVSLPRGSKANVYLDLKKLRGYIPSQ